MSVSPKAGRPTDNPKPYKITVRLDEEAQRIMEIYCETQQVERGEAVRRGLKKLAEDIEK